MMFAFALSGLQEFLYDLAPETPSSEERRQSGGRDTNAARRLRMRSAILSLVPALVARELFKIDGKKPIYLGGGKLLISASQPAIDAIEPKLEQLYEWLVKNSGGKLGAYWKITEAEDETAGSVRSLLAGLNGNKWRAGRMKRWSAASGKIHETDSPTLGNRDWESDKGAEFGRRDDWQGFNVGEGDWQIGPWSLKPVTDNPDIALEGKAEAPIRVSIPTYTPRLSKNVDYKNKNVDYKNREHGEKGHVAPLFWLAEADENDNERTQGAPYLALLKLDGDGIGTLMGKARAESLDKYRAVSKKLSDFFGPSVMVLLQSKFPRIYLVYAGGDDMVATGYFEDVIRCALKIQESYAALSLGTVSAGISVYSRQSPILKAVEAAEEELKYAKLTKDSISIGGCRLSWDMLRTSLDEAHAFEKAIAGQTINRGALQILRHLGDPWLQERRLSADELEKDKSHALRWRSIPMMRYMRSRRTGWKESEWVNELKSLFDSLQANEKDWGRAAFVGTLASWKTKRLQEEE